ncbi:TPA: AraC family transcriptional regulator [Escherichia coli]|nr:AraC family transcriptional regulator [Escherichia coli]HEI3626809.1 AraC family transcriptional regulator [Escherichia coli]
MANKYCIITFIKHEDISLLIYSQDQSHIHWGKKIVKVRNVNLYHYVIVYTSNCELILFNASEKVFVPHKTIFFMEKNTSFNIEFKRLGGGVLYQLLELDDNVLLSLRNIFEPLMEIDVSYFSQKRKFADRIFKVKTNDALSNLFENIRNGFSVDASRVYELAYLASNCDDFTKVAMSLYSSVAMTYKEKITRQLMSDISKKWKLSDLSEIFHVSEVSIRKRLELEKINFNKLVLDVRMNCAAKLIIRTEQQISVIAHSVGYASVSYFIKIFRDYYGVTPKQFEIGVKESLLLQ